MREWLEKTTHKFLGGTCVAVLCAILVAGLWPFHSPKNQVAWLEGALRFSYPGTVVSTGRFEAADALGSSCSIEIWAEPAIPHDSNTLLAFHTAHNPLQLTLEQSDTDLLVKRDVAHDPGERRTRRFYVDGIFGTLRPLFITISSGAQGTSVYINGALVRMARQFRIAASDCTGRLIVATSPVGNEAWTGQVRGLAIYHHELTAAQVVRHYQTWTGEGRPDLTDEEHCVALYLFFEHGGRLVHNQKGPGPDLQIPEKFQIEDQTFLMPFWEGFDPPDIVENIIGFVPLGFLFYAYFSRRTSVRRIALVATVLGALVSLTIEVLQAYLPTRQSDTTDIITNTLGTWLGVMLCRYASGLVAQWERTD